MSEPTQPGPEPAPAPEPASTPAPESAAPPSSPPSDAPITAREAADLISGRDTQSSEKDDAAPPQEPRSETEAQEPQNEPLEAPRSWPKKEREAFAALTREHQEAFLARDRAREADIQLGLKQAAEQRRAAEAMAQQAEQAQAQARWQYEQSLPQQALLLDAQYREEFGTPTWAELKEWQRTDPLKYQAWDVAYKQLQAASAELQAQQAQQYQQQYQQQQQFMQNAEAWRAEEAVKFAEAFPEWKDPEKYQANVSKVMEFMKESGFEQDFLQRAATEFLPIQIHDSRFQTFVWKSYLYDEATKAAKSPSRAPVPPVQRPGSAPAKGEAQEARFKDLNRQLDRTGSAKDAARLIAAMNGGRSS